MVFFFHHSISITQFPSLITHHFKYYIRLAPSFNFHHSIFFTLFVGPIPVTHCRLFFSFFFSVPKLTKPSEKKKKPGHEDRTSERRHTCHSSLLITHHSSLITLKTTSVWHHHSISIPQYFSHYLWAPYLSLIAGFFFCQYPNSPNLV